MAFTYCNLTKAINMDNFQRGLFCVIADAQFYAKQTTQKIASYC